MPFRPRLQKHCAVRMLVFTAIAVLSVTGFSQTGFSQSVQVPPTIFKNYFVTGDYLVAGWQEGPPDGSGYATGIIRVPDNLQPVQAGVPSTIPKGADIVAAYLYWATVEGNQSTFVGQQAFFNGYKIVGSVLGNPKAPTSWSSGGCTGSSTGSKTMRMYRADVRPYLPVDLDPASPTFGALAAQVVDQTGIPKPITVLIADSGSTGNTQPNALGATLVLIYRVLTPQQPTNGLTAPPLNAIVLYDGSYAPNNGQLTMTDTIKGFYEPDSIHAAKLTQIVANGQMNKGESVNFSGTTLNSLYGPSVPPFPGIYGAWDNPTWDVTSIVKAPPLTPTFDKQETLSVSPSSTNSGCVNWGAIVFSTTVQDKDQDGLLDIWEQNSGYDDAVSNNHIDLPNASPDIKDLYVEVDYLALRDSQGKLLHSHLPKQQALDAVGSAFYNASPMINVHFDVGSGIYVNDPYVIANGVGGNEISESALLCTSATTCAFPNQPAISWKGGFEAIKNDTTLGNLNFQAGRGQSYRYALFGHSLGEPRSYWGSIGAAFAASDPTGAAYSMTQLVSIQDTGNVARVTIKSPTLLAQNVVPQVSPLIVKPGDCIQSAANLVLPRSCFDPNGALAANAGTVTVSGAFLAPMIPASGSNPPQPGTPPLNGTYAFDPTSLSVSAPDTTTGLITTSFNIPTTNVPDGIYQFSCPSSPTNPPCFAEPQLGVSYLGPTSSSGHADFPGGGDLAVTFGLWGADNAANCVLDPATALSSGQVYCDDQVGTLKAQTGTLMHEMGHTLTLAHSGTYYPQGSSVPSYDLNCKPNHISVMNYLFQIRGFVDGTVSGVTPHNQFDFSGQELPPLNESTLDESQGVNAGQAAEHLTRWYSQAGPADNILNDKAVAHCDGTPLLVGEPAAYRVDGKLGTGGVIPAALDFNNDLTIDAISAAPGTPPPTGEDLNHNGVIGDSFQGFDDWANVDLQQMNARGTGFGFSDGGGLQLKGGGGLQLKGGGGVDNEGGGLQLKGGGGLQLKGGGGLQLKGGGGIEQDTENANSTVDAPSGLRCTTPLTLNGTIIPACTLLSGGVYQEKAKAIPLSWSAPDFGQIRSYTVWRATGSFPTRDAVLQNIGKFTNTTISGAPPTTSYLDTSNLKSNTTYTYFVTDSNSFKANSSASAPLVVLLK